MAQRSGNLHKGNRSSAYHIYVVDTDLDTMSLEIAVKLEFISGCMWEGRYFYEYQALWETRLPEKICIFINRWDKSHGNLRQVDTSKVDFLPFSDSGKKSAR